jgi:hypothetical protein
MLEKPSTIKKLWLGLRVLGGNTNFEEEYEFSLRVVHLDTEVYLSIVDFSGLDKFSYFFLGCNPFRSISFI